MKYTPDNITSLEPHQIFCMGTNLSGIHGAGAARTGYELFGAEYGVGFGRTGQCYAIPTKDKNIQTLSLSEIKSYIRGFLDYAFKHPELEFLLTPIGTGLAGIAAEDIAPLFPLMASHLNIELPKNIIWPKVFSDIIFT